MKTGNGDVSSVNMSEPCYSFEHPMLWSTKRNDYICPFCEGQPVVSTDRRIFAEFDMEPYDYQEKILATEGHRVMVAGRQVGKTTTAAVEAVSKSRDGRVLAYFNSNPLPNILSSRYADIENIDIYETNLPAIVDDYDHLVVGEARFVPTGILNPREVSRRFKSSLICGTPIMRKSQLEVVAESRLFVTKQIPMWACPAITEEAIQAFYDMKEDDQVKMEVEAEFP